jgi:hypothetical protein
MPTPELVKESFAARGTAHAGGFKPVAGVRVIRTVSEVEEVRNLWLGWKGHRDSDIDGYLEFIQSRPEVLRPHVLVLYRQGSPVAMLIGRLERAMVQSRIGYFRLPGVSALTLSFVYGGLRGEPSEENSEAFVTSILDSLRAGEADMAFLHQVSQESALYKKALSLPGRFSRDYLAHPEPHHFMRLPSTPEQLQEGVSSGLKKQIRRDRKRLSEKFNNNLRVSCYRESADVERAAADMELVAQKTYQRGLGVGFSDTPVMRARLDLFARKGWLRAWVLYLNDVPSAFWTGTLYDGNFCLDYIAYDPALREYSPGTLLMMNALEDLCSEGVDVIDFGFGQADYKQRFGNLSVDEASIHIFAPNLGGCLLNAMRTLPSVIDRAAKAALRRTNLLPRIKKMWRSRMRKKAELH